MIEPLIEAAGRGAHAANLAPSLGVLWAELFETGRIADLVLLVAVLEGAALMVAPRLRGAMSRIDVAALLLPGVFLILALRTEMTQAPDTMTAAFLAAAFVSHGVDLMRRRAAR